MKREEKSLIEFKQIMDDIVHLLRKSTQSQTVYLNWVNRSRQQFVLETNSTSLPNVMFRDRVMFNQHYLEKYAGLDQLKQLKVGVDVEQDDLNHYYDFVPVRHLLLIPFRNNGETVAITVIESETRLDLSEHEPSLSAYRNALANVLNTYLELTDLHGREQIWSDYEESLSSISHKQHKVEIISRMADEMQKLMPTGGVSVLLRGMEVWTNVFNTKNSDQSPVPGLVMEEKSMAYDALQKGDPQFSIHFNQNPKRVSGDEETTEGATLAIPLVIDGRRHGVVLAYDKNPLTFKESTKHQLINLARVAVLSIQVNLDRLPVDKDLFTSDYGNFIPDLWEMAIKKELNNNNRSAEYVWFGLITIDNLQSIRSRFRLEELNRIQRTLVKLLNPSLTGFRGYIGYNTDYVFTYLLFCNSKDQHMQWMKSLEDRFQSPIELSDGKQVKLSVKCGYVPVEPGEGDVYEIIKRAKKELSGVLNATG